MNAGVALECYLCYEDINKHVTLSRHPCYEATICVVNDMEGKYIHMTDKEMKDIELNFYIFLKNVAQFETKYSFSPNTHLSQRTTM